MASSLPPNQTLYLRGLNEKVPKKQLRTLLYCLFTQFGSVLDVVALKTLKMRGQAFIVFGRIEEATAAMRSLEGFPFLDRPLTISYATGRSNILNVIQGTYKPSIKPAFIPSTNKRPAEGQDEMGEDNQRPGKRAREAAEQEEEEEEEEHETNRILFVSNLPPTGVTEAALAELFEPYSGFKEVRLVPGKPMAFVEYDSVESARSARTVLHGFQISPDHKILVEFAKA